MKVIKINPNYIIEEFGKIIKELEKINYKIKFLKELDKVNSNRKKFLNNICNNKNEFTI